MSLSTHRRREKTPWVKKMTTHPQAGPGVLHKCTGSQMQERSSQSLSTELWRSFPLLFICPLFFLPLFLFPFFTSTVLPPSSCARDQLRASCTLTKPFTTELPVQPCLLGSPPLPGWLRVVWHELSIWVEGLPASWVLL